MYFKKHLILLCLVAMHVAAQSQLKTKTDVESQHGMKGSSRLTVGLGHTHVSKGKVDGNTKWLALPSWSVNYDYWLSNKWAIGLQNDLIMESFVIENHEQELIERKYPVAVVPVALFKAGKHLTLIGGIGAEFSNGHNLTTTRLGMELGFHLPKKWEVGAAVVWDDKWNYYNSWGLAFTFSKIWSPAKSH